MKPIFNTAIHECGHAVAACLFGIPIRHVTIVPEVWRERNAYGLIIENEMTGNVQHFHCFYNNIVNSNFWKKSNDYSDIIHAIIMTNCAGNVAELLEFGYAPGFIYSPDYRFSEKILRIILNETNPEFTISNLFEKTKQMMRYHKRIVQMMARYLELKEDISGNDFLRLTIKQMDVKVEDVQQMQLLCIRNWLKK